jgi:hypothetical protein
MDDSYLKCVSALMFVYNVSNFEAQRTVQRLRSEGWTDKWIYAEIATGRIKPDAIEVVSQVIDS